MEGFLFIMIIWTIYSNYTIKSFFRGHSDERTFWWEDILMRGHSDERTFWWEDTLVRGHSGERTLWWEDTLVRGHSVYSKPDLQCLHIHVYYKCVTHIFNSRYFIISMIKMIRSHNHMTIPHAGIPQHMFFRTTIFIQELKIYAVHWISPPAVGIVILSHKIFCTIGQPAFIITITISQSKTRDQGLTAPLSLRQMLIESAHNGNRLLDVVHWAMPRVWQSNVDCFFSYTPAIVPLL